MSDKMKNYYEAFVKSAIKSKEQLNNFVTSYDMQKKFSTAELAELSDMWIGKPLAKAATKASESFSDVEAFKGESDALKGQNKNKFKR